MSTNIGSPAPLDSTENFDSKAAQFMETRQAQKC
ncbi:hypothetical protein SHM7688_03912 [Shimia marina]|uniref:Uncharacterized protein n=1 Tax=Shimia marina TaxID=321267 RepID=A0A0P1FF09_9RHOB|nr:hypothetical protein SHM7688_03912 [Shimia marina]